MTAARNTLAAVAALLLFSTPAYAANTIGDRLQSVIQTSLGPVLFLISALCFAGGLALLGKGLMNLAQASSGGREGYAPALYTILAATLMIALPQAAGVGISSIMGSGGSMITSSDLQSSTYVLDAPPSGASVSATYAGMASVGAPTNCFTNQETVTCIAKNLSSNVVPIGIIIVFAFTFLAGLWTIGAQLMSLTKTEGRGAPDGFWAKLVAGVLLCAAPGLFMSVSETLLGTDDLVTTTGIASGSSLLTYSINASSKLKQYEDLIGYLFVILALFGVIAFVRGVFIVKAAGDGGRGGQAATYGHGMTYMAAGIMLANAKISTCTILTTAGLQTLNAFGFCN